LTAFKTNLKAMFKIQIADFSYNKREKAAPYAIRYELIPDISKGVENKIIHESRFSNLRKARKVADTLSQYLQSSAEFLDLVYTKLKQIEISVNDLPKQLRVDFNRVEKHRSNMLIQSLVTLPAHEHISNILQFCTVLKYWCFAISKDFRNKANQLFAMLLNFEESFINAYRSAEQLTETKQLKLFA